MRLAAGAACERRQHVRAAGKGRSGHRVQFRQQLQRHPGTCPCTSGSPLTHARVAQLSPRMSHWTAVADITAGPTLMLSLACASPVAACRREPLREPPWVRWTGHAALEAPACLPLRWAAGAADLRHGWPKQAGRAAAGWQVRGSSPCGEGAWRGRVEAGLVLGGARAGQDASFGYYAAPVSIVLPAVKLSAHAGMVGVPA